MTTELERARIRQARQAALRNRLIGDGLLPNQADELIRSWMRLGGDPDVADFWERGYRSIRNRLEER